MFAAQGYIVVAPNYAGYDISTLGYHPFLNAVQQSGEMMDILAAARTALPNTMSSATSDNGQLFLTGYSEGGYRRHGDVARDAGGRRKSDRRGADVRSLCARGLRRLDYSSAASTLGSTEFSPLLANSYQHAYGNVDSTANPLFSSTYAGAETLLPSDTPIDTIFQEGLLPETALFDSTTPVVASPAKRRCRRLTALLGVPPTPGLPLSAQTPMFQLGFGNPYLIKNNFRVSYALDAATNPDGAVPTRRRACRVAKVKPTQGLRQDFWVNDMRNGAWAPMSPTLLCGGDQDPTVYFQREHRDHGRLLERTAGRSRDGARCERHAGGPVRGRASRLSDESGGAARVPADAGRRRSVPRRGGAGARRGLPHQRRAILCRGRTRDSSASFKGIGP